MVTIIGVNNFDDFDVVVLSYEVGLKKPDMVLYRLVAKRLGVEIEDCVWIDDNVENLKNLPNAIHYQNPEQLELELRRLGVKL